MQPENSRFGVLGNAYMRQILLLRPCSSKVCLVPYLVDDDGCWCDFVPMVFLGILAGILSFGWKIHRRPIKHWLPKRLGCTIGRQWENSRPALRSLSRNVRFHHVRSAFRNLCLGAVAERVNSVALGVGAVAERGRMLPCVVFMFIWSTIIYDAIACWTWNPAGWVARMGGIDFAGGTPVHISSGSAALAYSLMLGKRRGHGTHELNFRPHNVTQIIIGTVFLWVGWFGFNAGSALSASMRAVMAAVNTNLAASVGGVTWCLLDYRLERKWSAVGFCSGVVAGLVAITPGSGYVPAWSAIVFGVVAGSACNYATKVKFFLGIDDALDIFAVHGIGGFVGNILTGFFAA